MRQLMREITITDVILNRPNGRLRFGMAVTVEMWATSRAIGQPQLTAVDGLVLSVDTDNWASSYRQARKAYYASVQCAKRSSSIQRTVRQPPSPSSKTY